MSQKIKDASIPTIPFKARFSRWFGRNLLRIYMIFGFTYLFIPVAYTSQSSWFKTQPTKQASKPVQRPKHFTPNTAIVMLAALLGLTYTAFAQTASWASGWQPQASAKTTQVPCACGTPAASLHKVSAFWKPALKPTQRCSKTSWAWSDATPEAVWIN